MPSSTQRKTKNTTYHEGVVEGGKDMGDSEVLLALGNLGSQSHNFLNSLFFLLHVSLWKEKNKHSKHTGSLNNGYHQRAHHFTKISNYLRIEMIILFSCFPLHG